MTQKASQRAFVSSLVGNKGLVWSRSAEDLPLATGAYLLLIELDTPVHLPRRFEPDRLSTGTYIYAGSARGPGGIRARCARHLHRPKKRHWHIDWLTGHDGRCWAAALPDSSECTLAQRLIASEHVDVPIDGFGSSDCRACPSHLVKLVAP